MHVYIARCLIQELHAWGYSSVVEHPAAVRQVLGSTPSVPFDFFSLSFGYFFFSQKKRTRAKPGFEPGTSCTQSRNHTPRPFGHCGWFQAMV